MIKYKNESQKTCFDLLKDGDILIGNFPIYIGNQSLITKVIYVDEKILSGIHSQYFVDSIEEIFSRNPEGYTKIWGVDGW